MATFFQLEAAYLIIGGVMILITLYVTTRPFMSKSAPKKGLIGVTIVVALMVGGHYALTVSRMQSVREAFAADKEILCESRMLRKVAQSVVVRKSRGWDIQGDTFVSPLYVRPFHLSRCIVAKAISLR
jgi:hypothetical protein